MRSSHAIVFVTDRKASVAFYRDVIGMPLRFETSSWLREVFLLALVGFAALSLGACAPPESGDLEESVADGKARRPNFVVLFADDLGYGDLGSYGHPSIRTPNLDRLAAEGQRWTDFYVASPVCSPSRGALLTGRLPPRTGLYGRRLGVYFENDPGGMPDAEITLAEALQGAGYATNMIGKWHLGDRKEAWPTRHGFDRWFGIPYSNDMNWEVGRDFASMVQHSAEGRTEELVADRQMKWQAYLDPKSEYWNVPVFRSATTADGYADETAERPAQQETITRRYTEEAERFLRQHVAEDSERPFLLYVAYAMPHIPLFRSDEFVGHSRAGRYGDVIEEMDASAGQIAAVLDELGLAKDTLLVFTSDNGPWLHVGGRINPDAGSPGPLSHGKGTTFEGGMREPAVFWWPGTIAPGVVSELGTTMDLFTTATALAGVELPQDRVYDGVDLSAVLRGEGPSPRETFPYYRSDELQAFRKGRYKIRLVSEGAYDAPPARQVHEPPLLFDLWEDPGEQLDIAAQRPEVLADLVAAMEAHRQSFEPAEPEFDRRLLAANNH